MELGEAPLTAEVLWEEHTQEAKHASRVLGKALHLEVGGGWRRSLDGSLRLRGNAWNGNALRACLEVRELLLCHGCERDITADAVHVDSSLVGGTPDKLGHWVEREAEDICLISAATQFLNLLTRLG